MKNPLLCALALLILVRPAAAQEPARVMVLGTYHFANPGLDVVQTSVADVLTPRKQAEIAAITDALAAFAPTRIAVEQVPERQPRLDSLYAEYRAGRYVLGRNEVDQLGFRLAARLGLDGVQAVDHDGRHALDFGLLTAYAQASDTAFAAHNDRVISRLTAQNDSLQRTASVGQILRVLNDPADIAWGHAQYVRMAAVGAGDGYVGADLLAAWYDRNIRIFGNISRISQPGERVLVIVGAGHAAILRQFVEAAEGLVLVEPAEFL